ncbi:MAG: hypothetical protein KDI79_09885 [Anaerolineae bacterium]|nr:hypothetical protein [Anaerolineae bacterium]
MMRLIFGMLLAIIWGAAGLVAGAAFAYAFHLNVGQTLGAGTAIGAGLGFIYGVLTPTTSRRLPSSALAAVRNRLALEMCAWCRGSGVEGRKKAQQPCRVCLGEGRVLTEQPTQRCPRCRGKGRLWGGRRCNVCEGSGLASFQVFERTAKKKKSQRQQKKRKNRWGWRIGEI